MGVLALVPLLWPRQDSLPHGAFRLTVLDVGHGLAAIVETRAYVLIYDTGARFASGFDAGRDILLPALRPRRAPELMIVGHGDIDHSGGAAAVTAAHPGIDIMTGPDMSLPNARHCSAGQRWTRDGIEFAFLHPGRDFVARGNDSSCVLRISGAGGTALLTGDVERAGEAALVVGGGIDVDVVVAPHHGSATSSTPGFVNAVSASVAIFSAAWRNRWGFPRAAVVARWCDSGADVYVTGDQGAIEVTFAGRSPRVRTLRVEAPHYWRANAAPRCGESPDVTL